MLAAFGTDSVCESLKDGQCVISADTQVLQTMLDDLIGNGRCEGLVALGALYATRQGPAPQQFGSDQLGELTPEDEAFGNVIDFWWTTQFSEGAVKASKESRSRTLREVLGDAITSIRDSRSPTLGLYFEGRGHGVLLVAVSKSDEDRYRIHVWDSNAPDELRAIDMDLAADTWTFDKGAASSDDAESLWSGTAGAIDLTPLDAREGKLALDVDGSRGEVNVVAAGGPKQDLTLSISTVNGESLKLSASGTVGAIDDAVVTTLKSGDGTQYLISLPSSVGDIAVESEFVAQGDSNEPSRITVNIPKQGIVTVAVPPSSRPSLTSIAMTSNDDGAGVEVTSSAEVSLLSSVNDTLVTFVAATDTTMVFSFGFDPVGETVQYGIEIQSRPGNTFVKAQLGGSTSTAKIGETLQVTGLTPSTTYRARLIVIVGQLVVNSVWVDVATTA